MAGKAVISLTTGLEDSEKVTVAFLVAVGAAESNRPTLMFLTKEAVRLALADIVAERPLAESITCNAELWAACVGGAAQIDDYHAGIETAGLRIDTVRDNTAYAFLSGSARGATKTYGIKSISLLAVKP